MPKMYTLSSVNDLINFWDPSNPCQESRINVCQVLFAFLGNSSNLQIIFNLPNEAIILITRPVIC